MRWHIFCRVIDNFGDAGVCWRLAADLATRQEDVTLFIDAPDVLQRMLDQADPVKVTVCQWPDDQSAIPPESIGDIVIEAFACDPPAGYVAAMAERAYEGNAPVWINLEYLSAEDWVGAHHGLPSPHPRYPLVKHFYFPGFTPESGGLIREPHLAWAETDFKANQRLRIFLFGYTQPALHDWVLALTATELSVAPCPLATQLKADVFETPVDVLIAYLPFVPQASFDAMLEGHDLLFVRGEDSFVRAQWAGKPVFWQIYPQEDDAHIIKLRAFYLRYLHADLFSSAERDTFMRFILAWNGSGASTLCGTLWPEILRMRPTLEDNARRWRQYLLNQPDLVTQLRAFAADLVKWRVLRSVTATVPAGSIDSRNQESTEL